MPKIVDHEVQKEKVAEATWRVIRKYGIEHASVRNIAEEAGLSVGSMRHYFSTQSELFAYSMKKVVERVGDRVDNLSYTGDLLTDIPMLVEEVLPMDEEKKLEMEVWFAFVVKSLSDPSLGELRHQVDHDLRSFCKTIFRALGEQNIAIPDLNVQVEIERFYAIIDGLAIHAILRPEVVTTEMMRAVIGTHLNSLCRKQPL